MISTSKFRDWLYLLACNLIWASQFVMVKLVQEQMGPVFATFFPMTIATLLLIPIVLREKRGPVTRGDIVGFVLLGVGQVCAQLLITWGVRLSLASNAALLMLTLPVSTAVMAYFILGERMSMVRWISFILAVAGVIACSANDLKGFNLAGSAYLLGNVLIFASVNGSAFYNAYSKKMLERFSPLQVLLYSYYVVFVFMLPATLYAEPEGFIKLPHFGPVVWFGLIILAVFQYFLSMVIFLNVLTRLDATQAALSNYLIPFFGVVLAAVVLHEHLTATMIAGGVLVLLSTLLATLHENREAANAAKSGS